MEIKEFVSVLRPANGAIAAVGVFAGYAVAAGTFLPRPELWVALVSTFFITGAGNAINDYFDFETDRRLGKKPREMLKGRTLFIYSMFLFAFGLVLATQINMHAAGIALFVSVLLIIYSGIMQQHKFLGNWVVSLGTALTLVFGASITGEYSAIAWLAGSAFFANLAREMAKDAEDMKGDFGAKRTLPMSWGIPNTGKAVLASYLLAVLLAVAAWVLGLVHGIFYALFLVMAAALFYSSWRMFAGKRYSASQRLSKWGMVMALLAFLGAVL